MDTRASPPIATARAYLAATAGLVLVAAASAVTAPEAAFIAAGSAIVVVAVVRRPVWGVVILLALLLVTYGQPPAPSGRPTVAAVLRGGSGVLTVNNILGLLLATLLAYRIYRDNDWSFIHNRQVQLVTLVTLLLVGSALLNRADYDEQIALGLRAGGQDPMRMMISRALFVLLFVAFVRTPRDVLLVAGVFIALALLTAASGLSAALSSAGYRPGVAGYRAGGAAVLIGAAGNPNRLALVSTLAIAFIWEYAQGHHGRRWTWLVGGVIFPLVLTVLLTASRGGLIGLTATALLLFVRRQQRMRRVVYGALVVLLLVGFGGQFIPERTLERLSNVPGISSDTGSEGTGSIERRSYAVEIALRVFAQQPLLGAGLGNWEFKRFLTDPVRSVAVPHNSYLLALVEGGIVCLAVYVYLFWHCIRSLGEMSRHPWVMELARADGLDWLINAARVALLSLMVFSLFADLWESVLFYALIAIAAALTEIYGGGLRRPAPAPA